MLQTSTCDSNQEDLGKDIQMLHPYIFKDQKCASHSIPIYQRRVSHNFTIGSPRIENMSTCGLHACAWLKKHG